MLIFFLISFFNSCDDVSASESYSDEDILNLQNQINYLQTQINSIPVPTTYFFEGNITNGLFRVDHPSIDPDNLPIITFQAQYTGGANSSDGFWAHIPSMQMAGHMFQGMRVGDGYVEISNEWQGSPLSQYENVPIKVQLTVLE